MEGINWLDIIVLVLVILFGLKGLKNGIVREIFGIFGLIGGIYFAIKFRAQAGAWVSQNIYDLNKINVIDGSGTEAIVGFLALLFGIWIVCLILGEILAKLFSLSGLSFVDRIGGFFFSSAKVFLIFSVFAILIKSSVFLNAQAKPYFENSVVFPYLVKFGKVIMQIDTQKVIESINGEDEIKTVDPKEVFLDSNTTENLNSYDVNSSNLNSDDLNSTNIEGVSNGN